MVLCLQLLSKTAHAQFFLIGCEVAVEEQLVDTKDALSQEEPEVSPNVSNEWIMVVYDVLKNAKSSCIAAQVRKLFALSLFRDWWDDSILWILPTCSRTSYLPAVKENKIVSSFSLAVLSPEPDMVPSFLRSVVGIAAYSNLLQGERQPVSSNTSFSSAKESLKLRSAYFLSSLVSLHLNRSV